MPISSATIQKFRQAEMTTAMHVLLAIENPNQGVEFRFAQNKESVISNGETYLPYPFKVTWPGQQDKSLPELRITLSGHDPLLRAAMLTLRRDKRETFTTLYLVNSATPNTVDKQARARLFSFPFDEEFIDMISGYHDLLNDPLLTHRYNPSRNPAIFAGGINV